MGDTGTSFTQSVNPPPPPPNPVVQSPTDQQNEIIMTMTETVRKLDEEERVRQDQVQQDAILQAQKELADIDKRRQNMPLEEFAMGQTTNNDPSSKKVRYYKNIIKLCVD